MAFVSEKIIDEITGRIDIVELISSYIPLKRIGRNYKALCPFHHEKTASFVINPDRQIFHCFGCGVGGNAFSFLMQYERLSFPEAVELLAKKAGVEIPQESGSRLDKSAGESTQLYKVNELAADFYVSFLNTKESIYALDYLQKRGISEETVLKFKLGMAPDKWDALLNFLRGKNVPLGLIEKAGLVIAKESGGYYDRFRKRIIVPIFDVKERVIAFGARVLDNSLPKYLNSPETPVYSKSKNLFGLNVSKDAIREADCAVIVEGYFDLIMPYQQGICNIVASCGTALTNQQIRLLKRYSQNVIMVYDSDTAGQLATIRSLDLLIEEDLNVRIAPLPKGYDPDGFTRKFGVDGFRQLLKDAKDIFDYKLAVLKTGLNLESITDKAKIAAGMLTTISKFNNAVVKSHYIKRLGEELRIEESALIAELKKIKDTGEYSGAYTRPKQALPRAVLSSEHLLVKLMLHEQGLIDRLKKDLSPLDFQDSSLSRIVELIFQLYSDGKKIEPKCLINYLPEKGISNIICQLSTAEAPEIVDRDKVLNDCLRNIRVNKRKIRQQGLHERIKLAQEENDEGQLKELLKEFHDLAKEPK